MKKSLSFLGIIFICTQAFSQIEYDQTLNLLKDSLFNLLPSEEPGAAILATKENKIIFEEYFGMANPEIGEKLNYNHKMGIASMSKQFTGMAILCLVQEGKLNLDDYINLYLPELPLQGRQITIKQLLTHISGLPEVTRNEFFMNNIGTAHTIDQIIEIAFKGEFRSEPGEKYLYNNTGYIVAAALIEQLSGKKFSRFLAEKFFLPLEMNQTCACDYDHDAQNAIPRYMIVDSGFQKAEPLQMHFSNLIGGGSVISNVRDMAKWGNALLYGTNLPENFKEMWETAVLNSGESIDYGLGMGIDEFKGRIFYYHPGMGSGMNSVNLIFPEEKVTITVIRNISKPTHNSNEIALLVAEYLFQ